MEPNSRKTSETSQRKVSSSDPFKDMPIVWVMGKYIKISGTTVYGLKGGPGSGRSTQCELVSLYSGLAHVSSGKVLKQEIMSGSKTLYDYLVNGECVPNALMAGIIKEEMLTKASGKGYSVKGFLMDGYPMNSTQAATFVQLIGPPSVVIHLDVPPAVMNDRLRKRKNFDDSQEAIYTKIDKFTSVTMPLVRKWNGITIDATREIPEVLKDLKDVLKSQNAFEEKELDVTIQ